MMNIIEKLGGYEEAKMLRGTTSNALLDMKTWTVHVDDIDLALLEHRRANNIFEVRDRVVSTLNGDEDWKNIVCEVLGFHKSMAITTGFSCAIHHYEYRHATYEEIKAGRRL